MLEIKNLGVTLEGDNGKVQVIQDINLTLENKKIYVITGPNGGGKSSIAKAIMGIYTLSSGQIILDGIDVSGLDLVDRAKSGIGYAFQQPPRFKGIKVRELLTWAAGDDDTKKLHDLLFEVGLCAEDYLDREINTAFSGGELKRIEIASILARKLKVAMFDEPEAGIDLWSFQKLTETFVKMNEKLDTTIVIISHQERILRLADQVILVADGKISAITSHEKILGEIELLDSDCLYSKDCCKGGRPNA